MVPSATSCYRNTVADDPGGAGLLVVGDALDPYS